MKAIDKYLLNYAEPEARELTFHRRNLQWRHVLVIPAYAEPAAFATSLQKRALNTPGLLQIVVINRPDADVDEHCNDAVNTALDRFHLLERMPRSHARLLQFEHDSHLLVVERPLALPANEGVGLARKLGCDIALALGREGKIQSQWIHCTDADAELPPEYFSRDLGVTPEAVGICHPFVHEPEDEQELPATMALYELRLHHYRRGLQWAGSPYAFHTLGSCISMRASAYAQVRGFPRRAAAEDFYLLNKLAKTGAVVCPSGQAIRLSARHSTRVPFGTGPAVARLALSEQPEAATLFYHPDSFVILLTLLDLVKTLFEHPTPMAAIVQQLAHWPAATGILAQAGLQDCLDHCAQHASDRAQYQRQFNQWFDGFRTLKFIHALRDQGLADMNLEQSLLAGAFLWPPNASALTPAALLRSTQQDLGWTAAWQDR